MQSYLIGLWFTLRTHASLVYQTQTPLRQSIYHRLVPINIFQSLLPHSTTQQQHNINSLPNDLQPHNQNQATPPVPRPMSAPSTTIPSQSILLHHNDGAINTIHLASLHNPQAANFVRHAQEPEEEEEVVGHDSPNWSKMKSGIVLLSCTAAYSFIAGKIES